MDKDWSEVGKRMREANAKSRGYASFFGWAPNRDLEEYGPVRELSLATAANGSPIFDQIQIRGRGNDPPDLEAKDPTGRRVAIEVTELVDGRAIQAFKAGQTYDWAEWDRAKFLRELKCRLKSKVARRLKLKGGPYPGGYVIVVFTDEPELNKATVAGFLAGNVFECLANGERAYLLLSYDPETESYPFYPLHAVA